MTSCILKADGVVGIEPNREESMPDPYVNATHTVVCTAERHEEKGSVSSWKVKQERKARIGLLWASWTARGPFIHQAREERSQLFVVHADVGVLRFWCWSRDLVAPRCFAVLS